MPRSVTSVPAGIRLKCRTKEPLKRGTAAGLHSAIPRLPERTQSVLEKFRTDKLLG